MTVIAFDGVSLAADKQLTIGNVRVPATKIRRMSDGCVAAISGDAAGGYILFDWYEAGADMKSVPESQKGDDWAHIIVAGTHGCRFMFREPVWVAVEGPYMAWGVGLEAAMAAMEMGADARRAVEVASKLCGGCGLGVDVFRVAGSPDKEVKFNFPDADYHILS